MIRAVPLFLLAAALPLAAAPNSEIPFGIEAVTGFRSDYIWRGFKVGDRVADFQVQAEIALSNEWVLDVGGLYATETGEGEFSQSALFVDFNYETKAWSAGVSFTAQEFSHPILESGLDIAPSFTWHATDDLDLTAGIAWDTGAGGLYNWFEAKWSKPVSDNAFVTVLGGTSFVQDYYERSGWNEVYGRVSLTYALTKSVSVTPFAGVSLPTDDNPESNRLLGGIWFEVNF